MISKLCTAWPAHMDLHTLTQRLPHFVSFWRTESSPSGCAGLCIPTRELSSSRGAHWCHTSPHLHFYNQQGPWSRACGNDNLNGYQGNTKFSRQCWDKHERPYKSYHKSFCRFQQALNQALLEQLPSPDSADQIQGSCPLFYQFHVPLAHDLMDKGQGPHVRPSPSSETQDVTNTEWWAKHQTQAGMVTLTTM